VLAALVSVARTPHSFGVPGVVLQAGVLLQLALWYSSCSLHVVDAAAMAIQAAAVGTVEGGVVVVVLVAAVAALQ